MRVRHDTGPTTRLDEESKSRIRIVLVEDHALVRECLRALIEIESDFDVVGEFVSTEESLSGIRKLQPDVVVTDIKLPDRSGIELLAEIRRLSPLTRKLVLTEHESKQYICAALDAGADGYVLKGSTGGELMGAIRTVAGGGQFLCKAISSEILSGYLSGDRPPPVPTTGGRRITKRERQVLTCVAVGRSNKLIARELGVSPKTVAKHRSNLMRKLQLHNVAAITMFAIRNGLTGMKPFAGRATQLHRRRADDLKSSGHLEALSGVAAGRG
jgi:DNA-binding NarL/FixJ family response regulator